MRVLFALLYIGSFFLGSVTWADDPEPGWTSWAVPTSIETGQDGVLVYMPGVGDPQECGHVNSVYFVFNSTGDGVTTDQFLSLVMTAMVTGTEMQVYLDGCSMDSVLSGTPFGKIKYTVKFRNHLN